MLFKDRIRLIRLGIMLPFLCLMFCAAQIETHHAQDMNKVIVAETSDDSQSENDEENTVFC